MSEANEQRRSGSGRIDGYACFRCRFWVNLPGYDLVDGKERDNFGECRRYPPVLRDDGTVGGDIGNWPLTESGCYCGEFQEVDCGSKKKKRRALKVWPLMIFAVPVERHN